MEECSYKEKIHSISGHAQKLFALFEDKSIEFSFATHTTNEKETFKLIAKSVLLKLGGVVVDKHQFGTLMKMLHMSRNQNKSNQIRSKSNQKSEQFHNRPYYNNGYTENINRCGPMTMHADSYWCMRFEAKHNYFKDLAHRTKQFKNIAMSLSHLHQQLVC